MSRMQRVLGGNVSGLRSRSHHQYWSDCSPLPTTTRIDRIKQSVDTWNFIHAQERLEEEMKRRRILPALC